MIAAGEVLKRARSAIGHGTIYKLGKGGFNPASPFPWSPTGECDCSGFVAWCLSVSRHTDHSWYVQQNGGWLETSAITRDARTPAFGMFDEVPWTDARPGDLLVYGDHGGHQGHVGIVATVDAAGPLEAIHCSLGNYHTFKDAIRQTRAGLWRQAGGIVARCALVETAGA